MKKNILRLPVMALICISLIFTVLSLGILANMMQNRMTSRSGNIDSSTNDSKYEGNIDSGTDGNIDENSDTGEFGDATSDNDITVNDDTTDNAVESIVDGAANGVSDAVDNATDAVDDATGGNMWGIIIAIIVIGALAALLFAFFTRKK